MNDNNQNNINNVSANNQSVLPQQNTTQPYFGDNVVYAPPADSPDEQQKQVQQAIQQAVPPVVNQPVPTTLPTSVNAVNQPIAEKPKKKKNGLTLFLLLIIVGLGGYIYYSSLQYKNEMAKIKNDCSPVSTSGETKELDLNSTIVKDLYNKVQTSIREDVANFELNDEMKLYLAFRQLPRNRIYNSNCNYFSDSKMYAFTCKEKNGFVPTAFREDDLTIEMKKLFGEDVVFSHDDIQLANSCFGGYQYIKERGEYVQGECAEFSTTTFKAEKSLIKAESTESVIVLHEKVRFYGSEGLDLPERLKTGTYKYTFKLDTNYNYVLKGKEYVALGE